MFVWGALFITVCVVICGGKEVLLGGLGREDLRDFVCFFVFHITLHFNITLNLLGMREII